MQPNEIQPTRGLSISRARRARRIRAPKQKILWAAPTPRPKDNSGKRQTSPEGAASHHDRIQMRVHRCSLSGFVAVFEIRTRSFSKTTSICPNPSSPGLEPTRRRTV